MIKNTVCAAAALLILHGVFVQLAPRHHAAASNQWQENLIRAEGLIYGTSGQTQNIIVGSSLSGRLIMERLPNTYNLSLGGMGILDGLDVLLQSGQRPKNVFLEMNMVLRERHASLIASLNHPVMFRLRKWFPSLREENQPVAMVVKTLSQHGARLSRETKENIGRENDDVFVRMLAIQMAHYSQVPEERIIQERFSQLKAAVRELERRGATVTFVEMPVNEKLSDAPRMRSIREHLQQCFPPTEYRYIAPPASAQYQTTDGEHLAREEALRYTDYFRSEIEK